MDDNVFARAAAWIAYSTPTGLKHLPGSFPELPAMGDTITGFDDEDTPIKLEVLKRTFIAGNRDAPDEFGAVIVCRQIPDDERPKAH